VKLCNRMVNES